VRAHKHRKPHFTEANFWTKCSEKAAPARTLSYHHCLDVANVAFGWEIDAPFCIPLRPGGASAPLIADS
jgi:hypothetical protein